MLVNWDDYSQYMKKKVPNHQPEKYILEYQGVLHEGEYKGVFCLRPCGHTSLVLQPLMAIETRIFDYPLVI